MRRMEPAAIPGTPSDMAAIRDGLPSVVMKDVSPGFFSSSSSPYPVFMFNDEKIQMHDGKDFVLETELATGRWLLGDFGEAKESMSLWDESSFSTFIQTAFQLTMLPFMYSPREKTTVPSPLKPSYDLFPNFSTL